MKKQSKLPAGWTLAYNASTKKYGVRNTIGLLYKNIAKNKYDGGTKEEAINFAKKTENWLKNLKKAAAQELIDWKQILE